MKDSDRRIRKPLFVFKPRGRGLLTVLGELEHQVMEIVWARGCASVRDVYETLLAQRDIAYTTVMTTMNRLAKKGFLLQEKVGVAYSYSPALSRDELASSVTETLLSSLVETFGDIVLSRAVDLVGREEPEKIAQLVRRIRQQRRKP